MKKVLSVLCSAAVTLALFTISAYAADYATDPQYIIVTPIGDTTTPSTTVSAIGEKTISDAITNGTVIQISDSAKLTKDALATIAASDTPVVFETNDGVKLEIDPASITDNARAIDLSMEVSLFDKATQINDTVKVPANSIVINPAASGEFGFAIKITIPAQMIKDAGLSGNNLKLYYIDDNGNITDLGKVKLNKDGSASIEIDHASQYVLAEAAPISIDDGDELDGDDDFDDVSSNVKVDSGTNLTVTADTGSSGAAAGTERNPGTGVTLALTAAGAAGLIALISKKSKK